MSKNLAHRTSCDSGGEVLLEIPGGGVPPGSPISDQKM